MLLSRSEQAFAANQRGARRRTVLRSVCRTTPHRCASHGVLIVEGKEFLQRLGVGSEIVTPP